MREFFCLFRAHAPLTPVSSASKRGDYDNVDWNKVDWEKVSYDLSGVDWDSVFGKKTSSTAAPSSTKAPEPKTTVAPPSSTTPTPTPTPEKTTEEAPKPTKESESPIDTIGGILEGLFEGIESWCSKVGISSIGVNDESDNGKMWIGGDSPWKANFINDGSEDALVVCWNDNGFTGMTVNVNQPMITIKLPVGGSQAVSFSPNVPAACSVLYSGTKLATFGGIDNTWWEATFGSTGAFDVSRNPNMNGNSISSKGSKCTSDMNTCVFKCSGGESSCTYGYDLYNCDASNGGGGGYDSVMQGTGGGCAMGSSSETVQVTFSN
jgi:hypothetical protein